MLEFDLAAALRARGYVTDTAFSLRTAIASFQRSAGLVVDGIAGPKTRAALAQPVPAPRPAPVPAASPVPAVPLATLTPAPASALIVTAAQLRRIAGGKAPLAEAAAEAFNAHASVAALTTALRAAHFLAQLCHESDHLKTATEYASGAAYEGRADLGNVRPGDGRLFRGHGLIQVTGRANHREFTAWLRAQMPGCPDFEAQPAQLAAFPWAFLSAAWYWQSRKLNALADRDDVVGVTKKVNGGDNGLADRKAALARAKVVLGA